MNAKQKQAALKKLRTLLQGATQGWVADKIGVTQAYVSQIANGKAGVSELVAKKLAKLKG